MHFKTFEDVLDFAIVQEQAAQQFYSKLAEQVEDPAVADFYHSLVIEEASHENKLRDLKRFEFSLKEPDLNDLEESGYLNSLPVPEDVSYKRAIQLAISKEKSARALYFMLADMAQRNEIANLLRQLALQEDDHARFFQQELKAIQIGEN